MASETIHLKRAYDDSSPQDGTRVLVDRLWTRGIAKADANLAAWMKELGPSDELREWFGHQPERWDGFTERYRAELKTPLCQTLLAALQGVAEHATLTLVYGARDEKQNEAVVVRDVLLHERAQPAKEWDAATRLLLIASVVAAAKHDAVAPTATVRQFTSALVDKAQFDDALHELTASGRIRESAGGWDVSESGELRVRELACAGTTHSSVA
jgi:uncharacterized protein YeaO (DUF488 family)